MIADKQTARIVQVSSTQTITYDMSLDLYNMMRDVMDDWRYHHSRGDKCTVEKVIRLFEQVTPTIRECIIVEKKPTKPKIKGLKAGVWYDPCGFSKEGI